MFSSTPNILVVTSLTSYSTANYLVSALKNIDCNLFVCSDSPSQTADHIASGAVDVQTLIDSAAIVPDILFFIEGGSMQLFPVGMEKLPCLTAWYGIDTHMDYQKHLRIARLFDVTFVAQKEYVERLRTDGIRQVNWLPLAFASELTPEPLPDRDVGIAYVGSTLAAANPPRHALLKTLQQNFPSACCFGPATPQEMGRLYGRAKVVFNRSVNNDINMRFFEATGAGAVLVTDSILRNGIEELFEEGKHYLTYKDEHSLITLIDKLLARPDNYANIGLNARQHVLAHHTYYHRAKKLLEILSTSHKTSHIYAEDVFAVCLSIGLMSGATRAAASAMLSYRTGYYCCCVGRGLSVILRFLSWPLLVVERFRSLIRKYYD